MASQLKVDYDQLETLHERLRSAGDNMRDDDDTMQALASAVGDDRLAGKLRDFGHDWSVHRADISENIGWLRDKVEQIADELERIDGELASGLTNSAPPSQVPPTRGPTAG